MSLDPHSSLNSMPREFRRLFLEADGAFSSEDYETARDLYQKLADSYSDYLDGWFGLTKCHLFLENYEKFASCYAITKDISGDFDIFPSISSIIRKNPQLAVKTIASLADQKMYEESMRYITMVLSLTRGTEHDPTIVKLKDIVEERLEKQKAIKNKEDERKKRSERIRWIIMISVLSIIAVISIVNAYVFFTRSSAQSHCIKGQNYFQVARDKYRSFIKYGVGFTEVMTNLEMAKGEYERAMEIEPRYYLPYHMLGKIYMLQRDVEFLKISKNMLFDKEKFQQLLQKAKSSQETAMIYEPKFPDVYLEMSKIYYELIQKKEAKKYCNLAREKAEKYYASDNGKKEEILLETKKLDKLIDNLKR